MGQKQTEGKDKEVRQRLEGRRETEGLDWEDGRDMGVGRGEIKILTDGSSDPVGRERELSFLFIGSLDRLHPALSFLPPALVIYFFYFLFIFAYLIAWFPSLPMFFSSLVFCLSTLWEALSNHNPSRLFEFHPLTNGDDIHVTTAPLKTCPGSSIFR